MFCRKGVAPFDYANDSTECAPLGLSYWGQVVPGGDKKLKGGSMSGANRELMAFVLARFCFCFAEQWQKEEWFAFRRRGNSRGRRFHGAWRFRRGTFINRTSLQAGRQTSQRRDWPGRPCRSNNGGTAWWGTYSSIGEDGTARGGAGWKVLKFFK